MREPESCETRRLAIAFEPAIVRRGLASSIVVGTLLIAINHGSAILDGDVSVGRLERMALTLIVPYVVSVVSSVAAIRPMRLKAASISTIRRPSH
jgi:hypothetical protein